MVRALVFVRSGVAPAASAAPCGPGAGGAGAPGPDPVVARDCSVSYAARVIANVDADGTLDSLRTRPGFAGSTAEGARVADTRAAILKLHGPPRRPYADADRWHDGETGFWFDGRGRVARTYVRRR